MFIFLILSNAMMPVGNLPIFVEKLKFVIPTNDVIQYYTSYLEWRGNKCSIFCFKVFYL